jgi:hypothetical protein
MIKHRFYITRSLIVISILLLTLCSALLLSRTTESITQRSPTVLESKPVIEAAMLTDPISDTSNIISVTEPQESVSIVNGLTVRIASDRTTYMLGEPVALTIVVENETTEPITINKLLDVSCCASVEIAFEQQPYKNYQGPFPVTSMYVEPSALRPGERLSTSFEVLYNIRSRLSNDVIPYVYAFAKTGEYQVRAVLSDIVPGTKILAGPIPIRMQEPSGIDVQIWRLLQTEDVANFLQTGSTRNQSIINRLRTIVRQFPDSSYAPMIHAALESVDENNIVSESETQSANAQSLVLRIVDDQLYFVSSTVNANVRAASSIDEETLNQIIDTIHVWADAWNNRDSDRYVQILSRQTKTWQDWQSGRESRLYYKQNQRVQFLFSSTGTVTIEIIGFTIDSEKITVNVTPHFTGQQLVFNTMHFVQDEDGVWRLAAPQ